MTISRVVSNGKVIRAADNPLNTWVRSLDDGRTYRADYPVLGIDQWAKSLKPMTADEWAASNR